ncbi:hypothetical protein QQS21_003402 [Conoideocrella luteorostrata]|uniref:MARVEL domain-containing protein n=1 Tax=Conoideocrella luteorostrata TaxID=1105319 RepID=A0AAJ0G2B2_9HYPO|nr:hypothetical protein QQS21_003402 [Conoideocrella luteorostrata]
MFKPSLKILAVANHFIVWVSALIVTGIVSWFLKKANSGYDGYYGNRTHIIYQEVIAVITFAAWTLGMFLPLTKKYGGHLLPLNLIFSYLWLTSFIFSTQDWSGGRRTAGGPVYGRCGLKKTVAAFNFFAFFFLMANVIVEAFLYRDLRRDVTHHSTVKGQSNLAATHDGHGTHAVHGTHGTHGTHGAHGAAVV